MNRAVFFDKDGVLNIDKGVEDNLKKLELFPWSGGIIAEFRNQNFKIFIITNQPVVARGFITEKELNNTFKQFQKKLREQNKNASIDRIYYCPHHPNGDLMKYRKKCECRKPKPGMLIRASKEYNIDLSRSYMVGDRISDIIAGYLAGCKTIQLLSGKHNEKEIESDLVLDEKIEPDFTITNIYELRNIIL